MNKVNGITLNNDEVYVLQKLLYHLTDTINPDELAKKVVKLKHGDESLFENKIGLGLFLVDFMRHNTKEKTDD